MTTIHSQPDSARDRLGHVWIDGQHLGAGEDKVCRQCGIRKTSAQAGLMCAELVAAARPASPPKHDYDPFA